MMTQMESIFDYKPDNIPPFIKPKKTYVSLNKLKNKTFTITHVEKCIVSYGRFNVKKVKGLIINTKETFIINDKPCREFRTVSKLPIKFLSNRKLLKAFKSGVEFEPVTYKLLSGSSDFFPLYGFAPVENINIS